MEVIENAKLISNFIGRRGKVNEFLYTFKGVSELLENDIWYELKYAKFHSDWDWLVIAVRHCFKAMNGENRYQLSHEILIDALVELNKDKVYKEVIVFIKLYNSNKVI